MTSVLDLIKHYQHTIEKYPHDEQKVLKCIDKLFQLGVTVQHLQETGVGRTVNALRKEPGNVGQAARALVYKWKLMVAAEESDQEGDHNNDSSNYNGHGSGKDSDENVHQSTDKYENERYNKSSNTDHKQINGDYSGSKRKYHSSEEEDHTKKKRKHSSSSDSDDYDRKPAVQIKSEKIESESDNRDTNNSNSEGSESDASVYSEDETKSTHVIKKEPSDKYKSSSSKSTYHSNQSDPKQSSSQNINEDKHSKHRSTGSKHSSEKSYSKEKDHSLHKHKSSKERESSSEKKHKSDHKSSEKERKQKEDVNSLSKHKIDVEKHRSSSEKNDITEKHKSSSEKHNSNKSEKNKSSNHSHDLKKEKHKNSSEKETSSSKHKSKEHSSSSSKEKHNSSSKEKSKERNSSSKEKSHSSQNSEKKHSSSENKSKSSDSKQELDKNKDRNSEKKSKHKSSSSSSHKSSKSNSSKSKEDATKKKIQLNTSEDSEDGIDCGSGASFAEALGMISPAKPKKKSTVKDTTSPNNSFNNDLSPAALLAPTAKLAPLPPIEISALPEISPNYKPRPPPKLLPHFPDEDAMSTVMSSKNQRTKVYSGNKVLGKIPTLYEMCVHILQEHIDALEYTGGVPYEILKPVVDKATPQQLFMLEHYNPYLMEDTDHLWQKFCEKHFRNKQRQELETWREMYMRCQEEQENRLKSLTANIKIAQEAKKAPIKQTKMAYVDSVVKPPRNIARKQAQHGTAHAASASPAARVAALASAPNVLKSGSVRAPPAAAVSASTFIKPKKAPLMQKALQFMRGRKR